MRTSFHHQPEAQHPNSSTIHKPLADYPIFYAAIEGRSDINAPAPIRTAPLMAAIVFLRIPWAVSPD